MRVKMGTLAENLTSAFSQVPAPLRARMVAGRAVIRGVGKSLDLADRGLSAGVSAVLRPGPSEMSGLAQGASGAYDALRRSPLALKALGVAAPMALVMQGQGQEALTPLVNEAIQEGRTVYANDTEFLEKKAQVTEQILEKTASLGDAVGKFFGGMAMAGGDGARNPMAAGISRMVGGGPTQSAMFSGGMRGMEGMGLMAAGLGNAASSAIGAVSTPTTGTAGYQLNRMLNPLTDRVRADEAFASSFFSTLGSESSKQLVGLLKDMAAKAITGVAQSPAHRSVVQNLMTSDPILQKAEPELMLNAYHTMAKFAPTLATDENAVRSFLREATMAGNGPDYASIANLAKAESAIRGD